MIKTHDPDLDPDPAPDPDLLSCNQFDNKQKNESSLNLHKLNHHNDQQAYLSLTSK